MGWKFIKYVKFSTSTFLTTLHTLHTTEQLRNYINSVRRLVVLLVPHSLCTRLLEKFAGKNISQKQMIYGKRPKNVKIGKT